MIRGFLKLHVGPIKNFLNATPQKLLRRKSSFLGQQPQLGGPLIGQWIRNRRH